MKLLLPTLSCLIAASSVVAHATFQDLWVNGVDEQATCDRLPLNNNPVTDVTSADLACNAGTSPSPTTCTVNAGGQVTVEMHQQPGDRNCANEAISDTHHGPVLVYMAKVSDASSAVGASSPWFKIYHAGYGLAAPTGAWATDVLIANCGKLTVTIPADIPAGDYLLRAEVIALHVAQSTGGAQFYMSCYQLHVTGGGSGSPATVSIPGAYKATDPGILIDIYETIATYTIPGPTVYEGGGNVVSTIVASSTTAHTTSTTARTTTTTAHTTTTTAHTTTTTAHTTTTTSASSGGGGGGTVAEWGQCGGIGWTGGTQCVSGTTCQVLNPYYSQCL